MGGKKVVCLFKKYEISVSIILLSRDENMTDPYESSKSVVIGNRPAWFIYLMTHNERSNNFKCYTFIGITSNPFRKHSMHQKKALPHCKKTRPAAAHWVLAEAIGPFEDYGHAKKVKDVWRNITRGENGRHMRGMTIVGILNGHDNGEDEEELIEDERLVELKKLSTSMTMKNVIRCFSCTVSEDVPFVLLKTLPPTEWKPSESKSLTLNQVLKYANKPGLSSPNLGEKEDSSKKRKAEYEETDTSNPFETSDSLDTYEPSPFSPVHTDMSDPFESMDPRKARRYVPAKRIRTHPHVGGYHIHPSPFENPF